MKEDGRKDEMAHADYFCTKCSFSCIKPQAEVSARPERLCGRILRRNQQMLGLYEAFSTGSVVLRACVHGPNM